jgi:type II secretory pathway component PulF
VGEAANNLESVLPKVGSALENRLDRLLGVAIRLIEPLLLLLIAGVVGLVAVALLIPLSRLGSSL